MIQLSQDSSCQNDIYRVLKDLVKYESYFILKIQRRKYYICNILYNVYLLHSGMGGWYKLTEAYIASSLQH
jgi:hypothetical protein